MTDAYELDVAELLSAYASGSLDPVDVTTSCLDRLTLVHERFNVLQADLRGEALAEARRSSERWRNGAARPLEGIPFGVKDNLDIANHPTTGGSAAFASNIASHDSAAVAALRKAGAVPIAKLTMCAFAFGDPVNLDYGSTLNPYDDERFAGGSSTGSAVAVAARAMPFSLGSDSGGSVRIPASHCGIVGFKPTMGAVSRRGLMPGPWSLDNLGLIARSADTVLRVLPEIVEADDRDDLATGHVTITRPGPDDNRVPLKGFRVGVLGGPFLDLCTPLARRSFEAVRGMLTDAGCTIRELELPWFEQYDALTLAISGAEIAAAVGSVAGPDVRIGDALAGYIAFGQQVSVVEYMRALRVRPSLARLAEDVMGSVDVAITPTTQCVAPRLSDMFVETAHGKAPWFDVAARNTLPFNLLGFPAMSIPIAPADLGLPFGLQIIGGYGNDDRVLAFGRAVQARTDFHLNSPDLGFQIP